MTSRIKISGVVLVAMLTVLPAFLAGCSPAEDAKPTVGPNEKIVDNPRGNGLPNKKRPPGGD